MVVLGARIEVIFNYLTDQFFFVAGAQAECEACFQPDFTPNLWTVATAEEVMALLGFAVVAKKPRAEGSVPLRKLPLMSSESVWNGFTGCIGNLVACSSATLRPTRSSSWGPVASC